jgi:hypothetical protein
MEWSEGAARARSFGEHCRTGHIAAAVGNCYLIQFDKMEESEARPLPPMELYTLEELSRTCEDCGQNRLISNGRLEKQTANAA